MADSNIDALSVFAPEHNQRHSVKSHVVNYWSQRAEDRDLGLTVDFQVMDAENTTFEPETFDCIVTRNLTWTLPHLDQAYTHWYNLLKSGGCLINFDGDYCHEKPLAELDLPEENAHSSIERSLMAEYEHIK